MQTSTNVADRRARTRPRTRLLLVHPEPQALAMLTSMLEPLGCIVIEATTDRRAIRLLSPEVGLALIAIDPADPEALELVAYIRRKLPAIPILLFWLTPHPERAHQALRLGAHEVLRFPMPAQELRAAVALALVTVAAVQVGGEGPVSGDDEEDDWEESAEGVGARFTAPVGRRLGTAVAGPGTTTFLPLKKALEEPEREFLVHALEAFGGSRQEAAKALDINRTTLFTKMRKYGLMEC